MAEKEAAARIKINKLLESAGWRFFPENGKPANISLETGVTLKSSELDAFGNDFEKTSKGFIDFLLRDSKGFPLIVLEAKSALPQLPWPQAHARHHAARRRGQSQGGLGAAGARLGGVYP